MPKKKTNKNKKPVKRVHRKYNVEYRRKYLYYDDVKTTPAFKKELLRKINYTLSYSKIITKTQKNIINNIKKAKTQKTIVKNLERLWRSDYGLFKRPQSQPGIGFIGKKTRAKIEQERALRENTFLDIEVNKSLKNRPEVYLYLVMQYRERVVSIFAEYGIYGPEDLIYYPSRIDRAVEKVRNEIPALADLSLDDIVFIAFG